MKLYELYREIGEAIADDPAVAGLEVYVRHPDRGEHFLKELQEIHDVTGFHEVPEDGILRSVHEGVELV